MVSIVDNKTVGEVQVIGFANHESEVINVLRYSINNYEWQHVIVENIDQLMGAIRDEVESCLDTETLEYGLIIHVDRARMTRAAFNALQPLEEWG
jgi:hypothetical protein